MSHEPGHVTSPGDGDGGDTAIGQALYDPNTFEFVGTLRQAHTGFVSIRLPNGTSVPFPGGTFLNSLGRPLLLGENGNILDDRILPQPTRSAGGPSGVSLADQQALLAQQQAFQKEQTAAGQVFQTGERTATQAFQTEAAATAEENRQRQSLQEQASSLLQQWLSVQQQARDMLTQLQGQDPFRAAASASGQVTLGTTPQAAHEANLQATAGQELTFDPSGNVANLQGQVTNLQHQVGTGLPDMPAFVGSFAHGGVIDMEAGKDGTFSAKGTSSGGFRDVAGRGPVSFAVGEAVDGQPNPELVTIDNGRVTVTPVRGGLRDVGGRGVPTFMGGFSDGGSFQTATTDSLLQGASSMFGALGFENIPTTSFRPSGSLRPFQRAFPSGLNLQGVADFQRERPRDFTATSLQRLGISPRLVRNAESGAVFFRSDDGQWKRVRTRAQFDQFGFNAGEVVSMTPESLMALGLPADRDQLADLTQLPGIGATTQFGPPPSPFLAPVGDRQIPLADPRLLASMFRRLDVAGQHNLLSLYGVAPGVTADSALERMRFFTPSGRAQVGTTASLR